MTRRPEMLIIVLCLTYLLGLSVVLGNSNTKATQMVGVAEPLAFSSASTTNSTPKRYPITYAKAPTVRQTAKVWLLQRIHLQEWRCIDEIIHRESRWIPNLYNTQGSGAYGLGQVKGSDKYTANKPLKQFKVAVKYAIARYGTLCAAKRWHDTRGWY